MANSIPVYEHDPDARLDYDIDWSQWLPSGDVLISSTWAAEDPSIVLVDDPTFDETRSVVWLTVSGAELLTKYKVVNHIETLQGRKEDQTIALKVKQQ